MQDAVTLSPGRPGIPKPGRPACPFSPFAPLSPGKPGMPCGPGMPATPFGPGIPRNTQWRQNVWLAGISITNKNTPQQPVKEAEKHTSLISWAVRHPGRCQSSRRGEGP